MSRYLFFSFLLLLMGGFTFAQDTVGRNDPQRKTARPNEESAGLRILSACAKVEIDDTNQKVIIDHRAPVQIMINGKTVPSSPSVLYSTLTQIKTREIQRIELEPSSEEPNGLGVMLNFILKERR